MTNKDKAAYSDKELVQRFGDIRDQEAFAELVRRHGALVFNTARRIVGNDYDAEDACQATFFAFAKLPDKLKNSDRIAGWLHEAVRRTALFIQRTKYRDERKMNQAKQRFREVETRTDTDPTKRVANDELASIFVTNSRNCRST